MTVSTEAHLEKAKQILHWLWLERIRTTLNSEETSVIYVAEALVDMEERGRNFGYLEGRAGQFSRAVLKQLNDRLIRENAVLREGLAKVEKGYFHSSSCDLIVHAKNGPQVCTCGRWVSWPTTVVRLALARADAIRVEGGSDDKEET